MHAEVVTWLKALGLPKNLIEPLIIGGGLLLTALLSVAAYMVCRRLLLRAVTKVSEKTETKWDDRLVARGVFRGFANLAPVLVVYLVLPVLLEGYPTTITIVHRVTQIAMVIIGMMLINSLLSAAHDIYLSYEHTARQIPIKAIVQVSKVILFSVGTIVLIALVLNKTPLYLLSGLGALTAVLLIIFKDSILGLVAGVQLSANKMVSVGDWLSMPSHEADGDVIDIALTTVKVQNWDKSITTIPTYDLISKPFKNWRGMTESGGRRICRAINFDLTSVRTLDEAMIERLRKIQVLSEYIDERLAEVEAHNEEHGVDPASPVNGRHLTNIGTFRAYVGAYLRACGKLNLDMTFLVRLLEPTMHGVPIQIYAFTATTEWAVYEGIQADIFDHLLSIVGEFDLRVYQAPTGHDFARLS